MDLRAQPHWYVVRTRARSESKVEAHLMHRGLDVFLPKVARVRQWKDRRKRVLFPLFPGYCFTHICASQRLQVLSSPHVVDILSFNGELVPVPSHEIESIALLVRTDTAYERVPMMNVGDRVVITRGPLKGVTGLLVRRARGVRVELCVTAIAHALSVEVDLGDVSRC
jgi:transcription antitermination factor NusG